MKLDSTSLRLKAADVSLVYKESVEKSINALVHNTRGAVGGMIHKGSNQPVD